MFGWLAPHRSRRSVLRSLTARPGRGGGDVPSGECFSEVLGRGTLGGWGPGPGRRVHCCIEQLLAAVDAVHHGHRPVEVPTLSVGELVRDVLLHPRTDEVRAVVWHAERLAGGDRRVVLAGRWGVGGRFVDAFGGSRNASLVAPRVGHAWVSWSRCLEEAIAPTMAMVLFTVASGSVGCDETSVWTASTSSGQVATAATVLRTSGSMAALLIR